MEIQFQHDHVLTFCDQNKENFSQILLKFFKRDERNRRKVDGDLEVAELDDEECAELDEEEHAELDDEEELAEFDDEEEHAELDDEEDYAEFDDEEELAEIDDEEEHAELDDEEDYAEFDDQEDYPRCCVCFKIVDDGPVYFCEICDGIWVHKFCASLPSEIRAHPLHLQQDHSLTLQTRKPYHFNMVEFSCARCADIIIKHYYGCSECWLKLDCKCALSPDNDYLQQITTLISPDTKTQISHDSHYHTLFLFNSRFRKKPPFSPNSCRLCDGELLDLTYGCFLCDYYFHKRCVDLTQQEYKVQHPCHSHHPFSIKYDCEEFICDQCRDLSVTPFMAICKACGFKIDFKCAFLRDITIQRSIGDEVKIQISFFNHKLHTLSFFNYSPPSRPECIILECHGCRLPLSGPSYGRLECSVYLHKSCAEMPQIIQHPYHHFHKLYLQAFVNGHCSACRRLLFSVQSYRCYWCPSFVLHPQCAINSLGVASALKNKEYHQHDLYYFVAPDGLYDLDFQCNICSKDCEGSFYICLECKHRRYFHMECIGIPKELKHDYHIHPLTLMDPLTEDDIDESKDQYYCYACEEKRDPRYHAYSCQQCASTGHIFTAHIECVLSSELNEVEQTDMIKEDKKEDSHEKYPDSFEHPISPRCMKQLLIIDKINDHVLNHFEDTINFSCYICKELVESCTSYKCSYCQIYLDKKCAELPLKIEHNLHEHPLSILAGEISNTFICDGCHVYHQDDMCYYCDKCSFFLDRECASAISSIDDHYQKSNNNGREATISHLFHRHKLRFAYILDKFQVHCLVCSLQISGPTYCCYVCDFFLHDSCFDKLEPQPIQHPFHTQHPLHFKESTFFICEACKQSRRIGYECAKCGFRLDIKCAKYLTSGLQYKCHEHKLFCFVAEDIIETKERFSCNHCGQKCKCNASFYRCLDCDLSLHIECIPIPNIVKSVCHVHPLALTDSIIEKGRDEYYCDACENLRNPKHAAYYCKSCYFTAHIGCVLDEEEGEVEIL